MRKGNKHQNKCKNNNENERRKDHRKYLNYILHLIIREHVEILCTVRSVVYVL